MKSLFLKLFMLLVCTTLGCHGIRNLVRDSNNNFGTLLSPATFRDTDQNPAVSNRISWPVPNLTGFRYFGNTAEPVHVHYNGFLTFNGESRGIIGGLACVQTASNNIDLVSVYSSRYTSGAVSTFEVTDTETRSLLLTDLRNTLQTGNRRLQVTPRPIDSEEGSLQRIIAITWFQMRARPGELNTFQAFLILTSNNQWFVLINFRSLDTNIVDLQGIQRPCRTQVGVSRNGAVITRGNNMGIESFGFLFGVPNFAEYFSNEPQFEDLGSFVFDINAGTGNQPVPRTAQCGPLNSNNRHFKCFILDRASQAQTQTGRRRRRSFDEELQELDDSPYYPYRHHNEYPKPTISTTIATTPVSTTTTTTTVSTTTAPTPDDLANRFCQYRDTGIFGLSPVCNSFVFCRPGRNGPVAEVGVCPKGQNFNQRFKSCDFAENFSCFITNVTVTGLNLPPKQKPLHRDICHDKSSGIIADPASCRHFYACTNGRSIRMKCPAKLFFDIRGFCNWPRNVKCVNGKRHKHHSHRHHHQHGHHHRQHIPNGAMN